MKKSIPNPINNHFIKLLSHSFYLIFPRSTRSRLGDNYLPLPLGDASDVNRRPEAPQTGPQDDVAPKGKSYRRLRPSHCEHR